MSLQSADDYDDVVTAELPTPPSRADFSSDEEYAAATEFGKPLVASPLTVAIVVGMSVSDVSAKAIANLGWKDIKLTKPVFPGDTLYANTEVLGKRESKSRPNAGIVTVLTRGINQHDVEVCVFERQMLVPKKP